MIHQARNQLGIALCALLLSHAAPAEGVISGDDRGLEYGINFGVGISWKGDDT